MLFNTLDEIEHIYKLLQAEKEGRLYIAPLPDNTPIFWIIYNPWEMYEPWQEEETTYEIIKGFYKYRQTNVCWYPTYDAAKEYALGCIDWYWEKEKCE